LCVDDGYVEAVLDRFVQETELRDAGGIGSRPKLMLLTPRTVFHFGEFVVVSLHGVRVSMPAERYSSWPVEMGGSGCREQIDRTDAVFFFVARVEDAMRDRNFLVGVRGPCLLRRW